MLLEFELKLDLDTFLNCFLKTVVNCMFKVAKMEFEDHLSRTQFISQDFERHLGGGGLKISWFHGTTVGWMGLGFWQDWTCWF